MGRAKHQMEFGSIAFDASYNLLPTPLIDMASKASIFKKLVSLRIFR